MLVASTRTVRLYKYAYVTLERSIYNGCWIATTPNSFPDIRCMTRPKMTDSLTDGQLDVSDNFVDFGQSRRHIEYAILYAEGSKMW
jgi:hypothetical protein